MAYTTPRILPTNTSVGTPASGSDIVPINYTVAIQDDPPPGDNYPVDAVVEFTAYDSSTPTPIYFNPSPANVSVYKEISTKLWQSDPQVVNINSAAALVNPCFLVITPSDDNDTSVSSQPIQFTAPGATLVPAPLPAPVCSPASPCSSPVVEITIRVFGGSAVVTTESHSESEGKPAPKAPHKGKG